MGKEKKEEMRKKGMLQSANFIKERIQGLAFTTLTHTLSHITIITFSSLKKILGKFCFSFEGGELRGQVLSSRRGPTGDRR